MQESSGVEPPTRGALPAKVGAAPPASPEATAASAPGGNSLRPKSEHSRIFVEVLKAVGGIAVVGVVFAFLNFVKNDYVERDKDLRSSFEKANDKHDQKLDVMEHRIQSLENQLKEQRDITDGLRENALVEFYDRCKKDGGEPDSNQKVCHPKNGSAIRFRFP